MDQKSEPVADAPLAMIFVFAEDATLHIAAAWFANLDAVREYLAARGAL